MTDPPDLPPEGYRRAELPHSGPEALLRDSWDMYAREWIAWTRSPDQPDSYLRFHREHFLPLIPAPGRLTLDLACGEGRIARDLKYSGHRVLGVDWSFTMCKAAATHINDPISVIAGDAARLPIADAQVDCVIAFMCLQDIDDMSGTITEIARVLQDGKQLALAIVHPMYSGGNFSMTGNPNDDFVIKRSYFKPELQVSSDTHNSLKVTFFREHRPLQQYVHALLGAGFSIEQLHEVTDEDESKPWHRVPMFLDVLATRRPRQRPDYSPRREGINNADQSFLRRFGQFRHKRT